MADKFVVRNVPKVVVQSIRPGERIDPMPTQQRWFVVENESTGERVGEHDLEADALSQAEELNR